MAAELPKFGPEGSKLMGNWSHVRVCRGDLIRLLVAALKLLILPAIAFHVQSVVQAHRREITRKEIEAHFLPTHEK